MQPEKTPDTHNERRLFGGCCRYCPYPQELALRLDQPARLSQIQLLCHESRIPAKVEILVGLPSDQQQLQVGGGREGRRARQGRPEGAGERRRPQGGEGECPLKRASLLMQPNVVGAGYPADLTSASWKRLGFLTFDSNERTQYTARELKTVGLPAAPAQFVRFLIHRCHANAHNPYNQAGLVAVCLLGDPLAGGGGAATFAGALPTGAGAGPLVPITNAPLPYGYMPALGVFASGGAINGSAGGFLSAPAGYASHDAAASGATNGSSVSASASVAALAAELNVDTVTAERIRELQHQKQQVGAWGARTAGNDRFHNALGGASWACLWPPSGTCSAPFFAA